jgi:hypothetical protein
MKGSYYSAQANEDFNKARTKELFGTIFSLFNPTRQELLSFDDVKDLIKPRGESYRGIKVVPVSKIVGSEGRYRDFNKAFLPRHSHTKTRWTNVDEAHLKDIILPPIKLYEIGGVYFVRDGNHRVSVAVSQGVEAIDAEVISLNSELQFDPAMTKEDLKKKVILYERDKFFEATELDKVIDRDELVFSATGRYDEIQKHIEGHKYFLNENRQEEITFLDAAKSWHDTVFLPIIVTIKTENILSRFPGRTQADLYVWIVKHWDELKKKYGEGFSIQRATQDFSAQYGKGVWEKIKDTVRQLFQK